MRDEETAGPARAEDHLWIVIVSEDGLEKRNRSPDLCVLRAKKYEKQDNTFCPVVRGTHGRLALPVLWNVQRLFWSVPSFHAFF